MAFSLTSIIFSLFGRQDKLKDSNKDINDKGTLERYNESVASDFDEELLPLIENLLDNLLVPSSVFPEFIAYLESELGGIVVIGTNIPLRRKLLRYALRIYQIKGTKKSYEILLKLIGFDTVVIDEFFNDFTLDDDVIDFDDEDRTFDSACPSCSEYEVILTGSITLTAEIIGFLYNAIDFCEPINARLRRVNYNGDDIPRGAVSVIIDGNGDMIFNNDNNGSISAQLIDGNLIFTGEGGEQYYISENGDLIFISN